MKTVEEIYEEMLSVFREETGAEASAVSDLSVRLYAVAAQVYSLYVQADWLSRQCFPQSAQGSWLDRHAALRGLERRGAVKAKGTIRFSVAAAGGTDLTVPAGTVCATAGLERFETTEAAVLKAGETWVEVPARAVEAGKAGNVPAGSILVMTAPPVGVGSCANPEAFSGGDDAEEDEEEGDCYILRDMSGEGDSDALYEFVEDEEELEGLMKIFEELLDDVDLEKKQENAR